MKSEFLPTHRSLLARLKNLEDQTSWKNFFDTYWKIIYDVARRAGLADAEAQDVVQETIIYVSRKMPDFRYDPAVITFKNWLMQITRFRIIDQFRKQRYQNHGRRQDREQALSTDLLERLPDPSSFQLEALWSEEWEKHLMQTATERIKQRINPRQYQMFHLHVLKRMPVRAVADRLGVKPAEVYFAKYKVSTLLKKELKMLENKCI